MAEKTPNQQLAEKLLFKPAYVGDKSAAVKQEAHAFAEGYKKCLYSRNSNEYYLCK